jgi:hypothetical protein
MKWSFVLISKKKHFVWKVHFLENSGQSIRLYLELRSLKQSVVCIVFLRKDIYSFRGFFGVGGLPQKLFANISDRLLRKFENDKRV